MTSITKGLFKASFYRHLILFLPFGILHGSPCDLTGDGQVTMDDVYLAANQAVGTDACETADLDRNGVCDETDVEYLLNVSRGEECLVPAAVEGGVAIEAAGITTVAALAVSGASVTSYGAKCDGSTSDDYAIQKAFNDVKNWTNKTLTFPAGKTCIVRKGLRVSSASGWTIEGQGAKIKAANGMCLDGCGPLFMLYGVSQFAINNLTLDGNRAYRNAAERSGGHNFQILRGTNGTFQNVSSINSPTDNARIGATTSSLTSTFSNNLTFIDSKFSNAFRNNVSVVEGWNIRFLGTCSGGFTGSCTCQVTGANGTNPEAGIDWEPNSGSASPAIDNGLVEGCLIADNRGMGHMSTDIKGARNVTLRNSIIRGNGASTRTTQKGGLLVGASGEIIENNWIGNQAGVRFAPVYIPAGKKSNTRITQVRNNFIDGRPPLGTATSKRYVVMFGNFTDGTPSFNNNKMTNTGFSANGDWCGGSKGIAYGNTISSILQGPNPGCP